ncbi:MAG TPA: phage terminase large subunit [Lysobacter sp.]
MATGRIELPPKLIPVFTGEARYRGAYGGRGSGKTRTFALMTAVRGYQWSMEGREGIILCGREFMNSLADSSFEEVKAAITSVPWLAAHYEIGESYIRTKDRRVSYAFAGLRHNLDSIKSKSRILLSWVDEAEPVSETAWSKLTPTVREHGSEIWLTWNPERKVSATHKRFREDPPTNSKIVEINYADNPWFPEVLEAERLDDLSKRPEEYEHVWGGGFKTVTVGAYYAKHLLAAKQQGRVGRVGADPLMTYRAIWDIGGTGAKADACSIWICQFIGKEIRVLDHYTAQGQELGEHVKWLRDKGYEAALCVLPHDGAQNDKVIRVSYESALRGAGFAVEVVPNMGMGAASLRVEATRRVFPQIWFNEATTEAGRESLGNYHEKRHPETGVGLGPNHDWSSHDADAFGLMAVHYEGRPQSSAEAPINYKRLTR